MLPNKQDIENYRENEEYLKSIRSGDKLISGKIKDQTEVFAVALDIHDQRSKKYGDLWKKYGALGNIFHMASKQSRLMTSFWHGKADLNDPKIVSDALDDAYDLLNYTAFFIRCVEDGNFRGDL